MDNNTNNISFDGEAWSYVAKVVNTKTYQIDYQMRTGFTSPTLAAASKEIDDKQYHKDMQLIRRSANMEYTFVSYLTYWYEDILQSYAYPTYQIGCAWAVFNLIIPHVEKDIFINLVTPSYINALLKKIAPVCDSAGHQAYRIINLMMKSAVDEGLINKSPMNEVDRYPEGVPRVVVYDKEQIRILLNETKAYHSVYLEVLLGIFCGLRPGEVLGLKFTDFDYEQQTVTINRQMSRHYKVDIEDTLDYSVEMKGQVVKPPKSVNSYRTLRVPKVILDELTIRKKENDAILKRYPEHKDVWGDYVCLGPTGKVKCDGTVLAALDRICTRCSLPRISVHGLRHIYTSILIEQGVPLPKMSKLLGHKSVSTTFNVYCGIIQAMDDIRSYVGNNMDPQSVLKSGVN